MEMVNWVRIKFIDPVLRELAYVFAIIISYIIRWNPEYLDKIDVKTVLQFAKATERNFEVSDYYTKIAQMRGFEIEQK